MTVMFKTLLFIHEHPQGGYNVLSSNLKMDIHFTDTVSSLHIQKHDQPRCKRRHFHKVNRKDIQNVSLLSWSKGIDRGVEKLKNTSTFVKTLYHPFLKI